MPTPYMGRLSDQDCCMKFIPRVLLTTLVMGSAFSYVSLSNATTTADGPNHDVIQLGVAPEPIAASEDLYAQVEIKGQGGEKAPDQPDAYEVRYFGPVVPADTMWSIATKMRPDSSVSIYQTMMAIFDANPSAFEDGDLHKLRNGSTLMVPPMDQILQLDAAEAQQRFNEWAQRGPQKKQQQAKQEKVEAELAELEEQRAAEAAERERLKEEKLALEAQVEKMEQVEDLRTGALSSELSQSQDALTTLRAENERLRLQLENANKELALLKEQVGKEAALQKKLADLLEAQRKVGELSQQHQQQVADQSWDQWLMQRQGLLAILTTVPTILLICLLAFWLFRKNKTDKKGAEAEEGATTTAMAGAAAASAAAGVAAADMGAPEPLDEEEVALAETDEPVLDLGEDVEQALLVEDDDADDDLLADLGEAEAEELFGDESHDMLEEGLEDVIELSDDEAKEPEPVIDEDELGLDDIDSLLADFDQEGEGKADASAQAISTESEQDETTSEEALDVVDTEIDDVAALAVDEPAEETSGGMLDADDIDALLAEAGETAEADEAPTEEVELEGEPAESDSVDDIDALLAEAQDGTEALDETDVAAEPEVEEPASETVDVDDLDALLAEAQGEAEPETPEKPTEELAEPESEIADVDDLDALLAEAQAEQVTEAQNESSETLAEATDVDDLDALLEEAEGESLELEGEAPELAEEAGEDVSDIVDVDDLDALLEQAEGESLELEGEAPELAEEAGEDVSDVADIDDLDALLEQAEGESLELEAEAPELSMELAEDESPAELDDLDALLAEAAGAPESADTLETVETEDALDLEDSLPEVEDLDALLEDAAEPVIETDLDDLSEDDGTASAEAEELSLDETLSLEGDDELGVDSVDLSLDEEPLEALVSDDDLVDDETLTDEALSLDDLEAQPTELGGDELSLAGDELSLEGEESAPAVEDQDDLDALLAEADKVDDTEGLTLALEDEVTDTPQAEPELSLEDELSLADEVAPEGELESVAEPDIQEDESAEPSLEEDLGLALADDAPSAEAGEVPAEAPAEEAKEEFIDIDSLMDTPEAEAPQAGSEPYHSGGVAKALKGFADIVPEAKDVDVDDDNGFTAKLDLARAYIEIDDPEGATAILKEVIDNGSDDQKVEAQLLLSRLND
ncbi:hypothetical protein GCM10025776_33700 [Corallincola platygyrae]